MPSLRQASWRSVGGDEWWWSANPALNGSLNQAISVFSIDNTFDGTARQLWAVLDATARQFPHLQIHCIYDARTKDVLDHLQNQGLLRWTDVRNPCSCYAGIEFIGGSMDNVPCIALEKAVQLEPHGANATVVFRVASLTAGVFFLISGGAALLRGITDPQGDSRSDDLLFGAAQCVVGPICLAISARRHRTP